MDTNYECPRCGYKINRKSSMRSHLFGRMVTCPAIVLDILLTENMKNYGFFTSRHMNGLTQDHVY